MRYQLSGTSESVEVREEGPANLVQEMIDTRVSGGHDDAFYVADLGNIVQKFELWHQMLPRVEPFYAVKCNDDACLLSVLSQLGTGFDCASQGEIQAVLDLQVKSDRIIYANPCKQNTHIKFAANHNVSLMTFDTRAELFKIKRIFPNARLLVRIKPIEGVKCMVPLSDKFGCYINDVTALLDTAKELKLNVVGVSFHVGSGCRDTTSFPATVASARTVFDIGEKAGYPFTILDVGGGFPGDKKAEVSFEEMASTLRRALDLHFPDANGIRIIAEPGRFFPTSAYTLCVNVIAKHDPNTECSWSSSDNGTQSPDMKPRFMYFINDGVYGSFAKAIVGQHFESNLIIPEFRSSEYYPSSVWGPTCANNDCILPFIELPKLQLGDWLVFSNMGAYTRVLASNFNGMRTPRCHHFIDELSWHKVLKDNY